MNFVIISYSVNFLGISCLKKLLFSIENSDSQEQHIIYLINNKKTENQINHFKNLFEDVPEKIAKIVWLEPYCDLMGTNNYYTILGVSHGEMIAWLVKNSLLENEVFLFLDHDTFVEKEFVQNIPEMIDLDKFKKDNMLFAFSFKERADDELENYTIPGFFVNTSYRSIFLQIPDILWNYKKYQNFKWRFLEKPKNIKHFFRSLKETKIDKKINSNILNYINFYGKVKRDKDTLGHLIIYLLDNDISLSNKIQLIKFKNYQHKRFFYKNPSNTDQLDLMDFKKEYFKYDLNLPETNLFFCKLFINDLIDYFFEKTNFDIEDIEEILKSEMNNDLCKRAIWNKNEISKEEVFEKMNRFIKEKKNGCKFSEI